MREGKCAREVARLHITACTREGKHEMEKLRQKEYNRVNMSQKACQAERESLFKRGKKRAREVKTIQ